MDSGCRWTYSEVISDRYGPEARRYRKSAREGTYKDGKLDGLHTLWYENGQKLGEGTIKDGELISSKCWDEDGNEKECN